MDANAIWKSRLYRRLYVTEPKTVRWAGGDVTRPVIVAESVAVFEKNPVQFIEALLLEKVARLAKSKKLRLITHADAALASRLRARGAPFCPEGEFYGAEINSVGCSISYLREFGAGSNGSFQVLDFENARFREMCELVGAIQGGQLAAKKQVPDAFLLYCAEENGATHFLTLDKKLIMKTRGPGKKHSPIPEVVWPSEILGSYWRYSLWPYVVHFIKRHPAMFATGIDRKLKNAGVVVQETNEKWTVVDTQAD